MNDLTRTPNALRLNALFAAAVVTLAMPSGIDTLAQADNAPLMAAHSATATVA